MAEFASLNNALEEAMGKVEKREDGFEKLKEEPVKPEASEKDLLLMAFMAIIKAYLSNLGKQPPTYGTNG